MQAHKKISSIKQKLLFPPCQRTRIISNLSLSKYKPIKEYHLLKTETIISFPVKIKTISNPLLLKIQITEQEENKESLHSLIPFRFRPISLRPVISTSFLHSSFHKVTFRYYRLIIRVFHGTYRELHYYDFG